MLPTEIKVGYVLRYSYLWHDEFLEGREEGIKDRPVLVLALVAMDEDGTRVVRVLPVTHSPPHHPADAVEIPRATKARLGLDSDRSWVVLTESNRFTWPGPDIRSIDSESGYYGPIPPALFTEIKRRFVLMARAGSHRSTPRTG